jgi:hypothetical protein
MHRDVTDIDLFEGAFGALVKPPVGQFLKTMKLASDDIEERQMLRFDRLKDFVLAALNVELSMARFGCKACRWAKISSKPIKSPSVRAPQPFL